MTKKLLILTTGGTIASVETPHGLIPALTSEELLSYLPEIGDDFVLTTKAVCNLDSTDMTPGSLAAAGPHNSRGIRTI